METLQTWTNASKSESILYTSYQSELLRFLVLQDRMSKMEMIMDPIATKIDILLVR
jgi:hypothetical protein